MPLSPPPELFYDSHEIAYESTLKWAEEHGYGFSLKRAKPDGSNTKTSYTYQCVRRELRISRATVRKTSTLSSDCKFGFKIKRVPAVGTVPPRWVVKIDFPHHNHEPAEHSKGLSCHRKRSEQVKDTIKSMTTSHIAPRQIFSVLQNQDPDVSIQMVDIYNEQRDLKKGRLQGKTPLEALLQKLSVDSDWVFSHRTDGEGRLTALFFAHSAQVKLIRAYPDVLLMDCTYRTNRYKMPLFHLVGVGPMKKQFSAAFAFMKTESEIDYYWVVSSFVRLVYQGLEPSVIITDNEKALRNACSFLFPQTPLLLCGWHVKQNVLTQAKHVWRLNDAETPEEQAEMRERREIFMGRWEEVQRSKTEAEFEQNWSNLLEDYSAHSQLINYLEAFQYPQRQLIVRAWTSTIRHYNNTTTSRIEGAHSYLKSYLENSRSDLDKVVEAISLMLRNVNSEFAQITARARDRIPFAVLERNSTIFPADINTTVSPIALELIQIQYRKSRTETAETTCSGAFTAIYGLPCQHYLRHKFQRNPAAKIIHQEIDSHWFFNRPNSHDLILPPIPSARPTILPPLEAPLQNRFRRDGSTRRDPSHFEPEPSSTSSGALSESVPGLSNRGQTQFRGRSRGRPRGRPRGQSFRHARGSNRVPNSGQPQEQPQGQSQGQPQGQTQRQGQRQGQSNRTFEGLYGDRLQQIEESIKQTREDNLSLTRAITNLLNARSVADGVTGHYEGGSNGPATGNSTFSRGSNIICATTVTINSSPERGDSSRKRKRDSECSEEEEEGEERQPASSRLRI